jgi:hypothetical protein
MYVILTRLKLAEDVLQLQAELAELCGPNLMEIAFLVMENRETLAAEFKVGILTGSLIPDHRSRIQWVCFWCVFLRKTFSCFILF